MLQQVTLVYLVLILNHGVSISFGQVSETLKFPDKGDSCNVIHVNCGSGQTGGQSTNGQDMPRNPGAPGKMGPVGPIGPKGTKGEIGLRGLKGEMGRNGPLGSVGPQGLKGEIGLRGPKGETGSGGPVGPIGPRGIKGDSGIRGPKGEIGSSGPVGPVGPKGIKGNTGVRGLKGESGVEEIFGMMSARSCSELAVQYGVNTTGYYPMRGAGVNVVVSNYCDFQVYGGITSCDGLSGNTPITLGYYRLGSAGFTLCPDIFTCDQLHQINGTNVDGIYTMASGGGSYRVHCSFSSGTAVTEVWHDSMQEIQISSCEDVGCYTRTPRYEIDQNSILKIIENSRECRQFIKWRCEGSILLRGGYGWWVSRQGDKMTYWGGATSRRDKYCACGDTGTCIDNNHKCNCDQNSDSVTTQDEGLLTDKSKLPVKTLRFGDATPPEAGWHTLGKLECTGQA